MDRFYHLPFASIEEIAIVRFALEQYLEHDEQQAAKIKPLLHKVELLYEIATVEEQVAKLTAEFRTLTGGAEPDDLL